MPRRARGLNPGTGVADICQGWAVARETVLREVRSMSAITARPEWGWDVLLRIWREFDVPKEWAVSQTLAGWRSCARTRSRAFRSTC
ncbi:hypothetical protein GCM10023192_37650 [Amycolatopsis samaneae]